MEAVTKYYVVVEFWSERVSSTALRPDGEMMHVAVIALGGVSATVYTLLILTAT